MNDQITFLRRIARYLMPRSLRSAYGRVHWQWRNWWQWRFPVSPNFLIFVTLYFYLTWIRRKPIVAVYQPGRVGSTAVTVAIRSASVGPVFHVHTLTRDLRRSMEKQNIAITPALAKHSHENDRVARCLRWVLSLQVPLKIIVLLRDPVEQSLSSFFFNFQSITGHTLDEKAWTMGELKRLYWVKNTLTGFTLFESWFENELKFYTGFNVFSFPFDAERGWQVYHHGKLSVLAIKMELDEAVKNGVLNAYLNTKNLRLQRINSSEAQSYGELYREFRANYSLKSERLDTIYDGRFALHFYTSQEIDGFKQKWVKKQP
jgi:hypothetical protein